LHAGERPGVDAAAAFVFGVVPTSAQRRLCRPRDCADLGPTMPAG